METEKFVFKNSTASSGETIDIINPFSGKTVRRVFRASKVQISESLNYLNAVFYKFRTTPSYLRAELLEKTAAKISARKEELSELITLETGKPIKFSKIEIDRTIFTFKTGSEEAKRIEGEILPLDLIKGFENKNGFVKRFPIGVILGITPWNFPANLVAHKLAPALASGNTVMLKPASTSICTAIEIGKIIMEASAESGLDYCPLNVIPASGSEIEEFISDDRIKMVSFTGSPAVGWSIKTKMSKQRLSLELGGNAGVIIDKTADYKSAVPKIVMGAFYSAGQSCISVQRVFVHKDIYDDFEKMIVEEASKVVYGNPEDEKCISGPMINEREAERAERWIHDSIESGAELIYGGNRNGAVLEPTIIKNAPAACSVNSKEIFAPVMTLTKFENFDKAVEEVNNSDFGLQAGVFTNDLKNAMYAFNNIETGGVIINEVSAFRVDSMPYGGVKHSGMGKEGIKYAIEEMTERKILVI
ncbi:MAG: aldehyde dehydrogenase family protein [Ignavibacteria bacterium]|nr:aldehyde dehydrogenase family protein [Ignavibacteria bacterium]